MSACLRLPLSSSYACVHPRKRSTCSIGAKASVRRQAKKPRSERIKSRASLISPRKAICTPLARKRPTSPRTLPMAIPNSGHPKKQRPPSHRFGRTRTRSPNHSCYSRSLLCRAELGWRRPLQRQSCPLLARRSRPRAFGTRSHSSSIARSPSSTAVSCCALTLSILRRNRSFVTARIWSTTATVSLPSQVNGTNSGGLPEGELDKGITTTLRRCWFTIFVVSTKQARVLRTSAPSVGSSLTHQTSPRRGKGPRLCGFLGDGVEFFFNGPHLRIVICDAARLHQMSVARGELLNKRGG